jgi:hypothetical protein
MEKISNCKFLPNFGHQNHGSGTGFGSALGSGSGSAIRKNAGSTTLLNLHAGEVLFLRDFKTVYKNAGIMAAKICFK